MTQKAKQTPDDFHWPLGKLGRSSEIENLFPEEAMCIGVITILWNNHEQNLIELFKLLLAAPVPNVASAIMERQFTHKYRRDLIEIARKHATLSDRDAQWTDLVIKKTKIVADRRNELMHGRYVVSAKDDRLYAEVSSPNAVKQKRQRNDIKALREVISGLEELVGLTEGLLVALRDPVLYEKIMQEHSMREKQSAQKTT
ncbi:MAG: hypothetical protein ABI439_14350 [Rhodospirillales bacterium]